MTTLAVMDAARLRGVRLSRGGRTVLDGVDLALRPGEVVGLLGPNGGGKTTLLRALLGLVRPTLGSIEVLGGPARPGRRGIGYMPQAAPGAARLAISARDFVACACRTGWGLPLTRAADRRATDEALDLAGAGPCADRPIMRLSGGQQQRVRLAQALLHRPRLLLLDEPMASLDPPGQAETARLLGRLRDQIGCTIVCSAHELNPLLPVLDRVLYVAGGHAAIGPPSEVVTAPVLTRLYGSPIEVIRAQGRIFVLDDAAPPARATPDRARA